MDSPPKELPARASSTTIFFWWMFNPSSYGIIWSHPTEKNNYFKSDVAFIRLPSIVRKKQLWPLAQDLSLKPIPKSSTHVSPFRFRPPWWPSMLTIVVSIALTTHVSFWRPLNHDEVLRFLTKMVRTVQWHFLYSVGQQTITLNLHLHVRCLEKVKTSSPKWRWKMVMNPMVERKTSP